MNTLSAALYRTIRHNRNGTAILDDERYFTWGEFGERVGRAAGVLAGRGVGRGARFAILSRNGYRFEELKWAGFHVGAVPVPINWRLAPPEIRHILEDSGCQTVFVEDGFLAVFQTEELAGWREGVVCISPASTALPCYETLLADANEPAVAHTDPDDDALLLYTGGTTGRAKGVRLSHWNILSNALAFGLGVSARRDDVYLHVAPMFHSADLLGTCWFLLGAGHCYLPAFSPAEFLRVIAKHHVTAMTKVPTMLMMTLSDPVFERADISSVRTLIYGASPMALEWIRRVAAAFPRTNLFNCYGLTEVAPDLTIFDAREFRAAIESGNRDGPVASVGKPNVLNELRVVGPDGTDVAVGEAGELWARGPNIMKGYLNLPEETHKALGEGWLRTGDIARVDENGYVYLLDRLKDLIISGGENIYASEVEAALHQHPGVHEAAVIGVADDKLGETLFAVIVAAPGVTLAQDEIIAHCRKRIGGYKIPRRMAFVDAMPKSALGKILKTDLRKTYSG
jgi:long-chain acyl-CoA synthetase